MRKVLPNPASVSVLAGLALGALATTACESRYGKPQAVTIGQLATMLRTPEPPHLFDANGEPTRKEYGVIPGATLLPSCSDYSPTLLPQNKADPLVFYCASTWCGAAEKAAQRALSEGHTKVAVLPEGIKGWREAGMPTSQVN
ncbi:MAG TPA: rhodanese-like domain-containing protein [Polyangiaceae bacterium]|nr:rhodanese-like domain-containing protein [Polyangiaceae bacterium]